jgi:hypothetical protein
MLEPKPQSFYFFDFDDNIAFLTTPMVLFHRQTGEEKWVSTEEYARIQGVLGKPGPWLDYEMRFDDKSGSFRFFRDHHEDELRRLGLKDQVFIQDVAQALGFDHLNWQGPSWQCFHHACFHGRPMSLITARGHSPETIRQGIQLFVDRGHLPSEPNFLAIYPVHHPEVRKELGDVEFASAPWQLKQKALRASVFKALQKYGEDLPHKFGVSDDDPKNIDFIRDELFKLKAEVPQMRFFLFQTTGRQLVREEVL